MANVSWIPGQMIAKAFLTLPFLAAHCQVHADNVQVALLEEGGGDESINNAVPIGIKTGLLSRCAKETEDPEKFIGIVFPWALPSCEELCCDMFHS